MAGSRPAFEAVSDFTVRALVILYVCILKRAKVVAVVCTAFKVSSRVAGLHNHFPLESLPSFKLLLAKEHLEVIFGLECDRAALIWAPDGKLAHLYLSASILSQALCVVEVLAGSNTVDVPFLVIFVKERHQADLTRTIMHNLFHLRDELFLHDRDWCVNLNELLGGSCGCLGRG